MPSYRQTRVAIKKNGNFYRIFSFAFEKDKYGEEYFKLIIPPLFGQVLAKIDIEPGEVAIEIPSTTEKEPSPLIHELSYHYKDGRVHFKGNDGYDDVLSWPKLFDAQCVEVCRIMVYDLDLAKSFKKVPTPNVLINKPFTEGEPREFNVYVVIPGLSLRLHSSNKDFSFNSSYQKSFSDYGNIQIVIADKNFHGKTHMRGIAVQRPNNPTASRI